MENNFIRLQNELKSWSTREWLFTIITLLGLIIAIISSIWWTLPRSFVSGNIVSIEKGTTLSQTASKLYDGHIIRSKFWFKVMVVVTKGHSGVVAGDYYFKTPQDLTQIVGRIISGKTGLELMKVTIPEGLNNVQIADILSSKFSLFDKNYFLSNAPQGYLFPDTYFFYPNLTAKSAIGRMEDVFNTKTEQIRQEASNQNRNFANIVVLASILEEEAQKLSDKKIVAGILQNRLKIGMALQVDSATTTYKVAGLPLVPISNPGLDSLEAALNPTQTDYLYYLSDKSGNIYYAKTFDEHQTNRELYLNK